MTLIKMNDKMGKVVYINPEKVCAIYEQTGGFGVVLPGGITYLLPEREITKLLKYVNTDSAV